MSESPLPALWSTVSALPDCLLLAQTAQLARHEQALQILVLDHLREIESRRLHLTRGYGSLFDYVVHELGYTAAAAWRRIKAMRLCSHTGGARELLQDGSLNLSNAAQLQNLFERSDRSRGRTPGSQGADGGPGGAPRDDAAPGEPAPSDPMHGGARDPAPEAGPVPGVGPVLDAAAREKLVRQAAGKSTREVQQMLAEVDPELARPSDRMRALGNGRWELKAVVDAECRHGLEKLQMLRSHRDPHLTLGGLVARLVRDGLERYDPERPAPTRRTGGRGSVNGARPESTPGRRDRKAKQRRTTGAKSDDVERRSEVERDDASSSSVAADAPGPSAAKRDTETERGSAKSAAVREFVRGTESAPKRHTEAECGRTESAAARDIVRRTESAPKRHTEAERGRAKSAAARDIVRRADSAPKRHTKAESGSAESAAARDFVRGTDSAPKRHTKAESGSAKSTAARDIVRRADSAAKRHTGAECGGASPAAAPNRGGHTASAAKRLAYTAGHGAAGPAARSPALERHLAALSSCGVVPGPRSRYIPVGVRREVWRRDQGCCSYVDRHSGRRCRSRYRLEIDHVVPFALGGATELSNLRLRCSAHHRLRHAQRHAHRARVPARLSGRQSALLGHVHRARVPAEARSASVSAVELVERGRTVQSDETSRRAGA